MDKEVLEAWSSNSSRSVILTRFCSIIRYLSSKLGRCFLWKKLFRWPLNDSCRNNVHEILQYLLSRIPPAIEHLVSIFQELLPLGSGCPETRAKPVSDGGLSLFNVLHNIIWAFAPKHC